MISKPGGISAYIYAKDAQFTKTDIETSECRPGIRIAQNIFNESGGILVSDGTLLDPTVIKRLKNLGYDRIRVYKEPEPSPVDPAKRFRALYSRNLTLVKEIYDDICRGDSPDISKVNEMAESFTDHAEFGRDIFINIEKLQECDDYLYTHSLNVAMLCALMARWLKYDARETDLLIKSGLLHDIGKVKVPFEILKKSLPLLPSEYAELKKHAAYGANIISSMAAFPPDVAMGVLMHHEREDGSGYPRGLKSGRIHKFAQVIAVTDMFDAMTSNRPHQRSISPFLVFELMQSKHTSSLDPKAVYAFLENAPYYYVGERFFLTTGDVCEILFVDSKNISRPLVRVGSTFMDLSREQDVKIDKMV